MNDRDWAIVVGIGNYFDPKFNTLQGPENDAKEFYAWVTSPEGGGVPPGDQATLIIPKTPFPDATGANPTAAMVDAAFAHFDALNQANLDNGKRIPVGRRLWVFFAGHGVSLTEPTTKQDLTALLTADVSAASISQSHVIGSLLTDYCWRAAYFEQVFLFMDCCRTITPVSGLNIQKKSIKTGRDFDQGRKFYAYGARVGQESREWAPDGKVYRGVFSMALLEGLRGAAIDKEESKGVITAESLRNFLYNSFETYMVPEDRKKPGVRKEPHVDFEQRGTKLVIGPVPPKSFLERFLGGSAPKYPVLLVAESPKAKDAAFTIKRKSKTVLEGKIDGTPIELEVGLYVLQVPDAEYEDALEVKVSKEPQNVAV